MYTNKKYEGMIFEKVDTLYLLGTKFDVFKSEEGIELYDPINLIKDCKQHPQTIMDLIDVDNRYAILIEDKNNVGSKYTKKVVDEPGLYQLFMAINNPRAKKFRANISNNITIFRKKMGYDICTMINRAENNPIYFGKLKPCFNSLSSTNKNIRKLLDPYVEEILINEIYEFPVLYGQAISNEYINKEMINHIDKVSIGYRVYYYINFKMAIRALSKTLSVTEELIFSELKEQDCELKGTTLGEFNTTFIDPIDIYNYIDKIYENKHLGDIGNKGSEDIFVNFLNYIVQDIRVSKVLAYSISRFKNIVGDHSYDILNEYHILSQNLYDYPGTIDDGKKYAKDIIKQKYLG